MTDPSTSPSPNDCRCSGQEYLTVNGEFWCATHQCWKTQHYRQLCQTRPGYRQMWEEGRGPGQETQPRPQSAPYPQVTGPGDILRKMLGCGGKQWEHYGRMNELGEGCLEHLDELAELLSGSKCASCGSVDTARRSIELAVKKWRSQRVAFENSQSTTPR